MRALSVARKLSTIETWRQTAVVCLKEKVTGTRAANPTPTLVSSPGEGVSFRVNFFYVIQRYVSKYEAYGKLSSNKYKHLLSFPTVTLRVL